MYLFIYGGAPIETQIKSLSKGSHVVVGTPGRTLDLINRKKLKLQNIRWLILDEADEMLNMGFKEELDKIIVKTSKTRQTLLFSATMPVQIKQIADKYMKDAEEISIGTKNAGAEKINHFYYVVNANNKYAALKRIADVNTDIYGIVFCRTRRDTKEIANKLIEDGYNADALHGDLSQSQRDAVMQKFRLKHLQILVATDVAARGLDVNNLSHIINYSLPDEPETYIHRSGRTGRAGNNGVSLIIIQPKEISKIKVLEKILKKPVTKETIPSGDEIVEKRLLGLINKIQITDVNENEMPHFIDEIFKILNKTSKEELIKKFISVELSRFMNYYKNAKNINVSISDNNGVERKLYNKKVKFSRFYINLGKRMNINTSSLIGIINKYTENKNIEIGKIDIMKRFSFFEIDKSYANLLTNAFKNIEYNGIRLIIAPANALPKENNYGKYRNRKNKKTYKSRDTVKS